MDETTHTTILHRFDDMEQRQAGMSLCRENRCLSHRVGGTFGKGSGNQDLVDRFHETPNPVSPARKCGEFGVPARAEQRRCVTELGGRQVGGCGLMPDDPSCGD